MIAALILLLVSGAVSYMAISKEANPDIDIPFIIVSLTLNGISPEDAERLMVRPTEEEMRSIEGVEQMTAAAYENGGHVVLEFDAGFNADNALQNVREAVDRVRPELPEEAEEPVVTEINTSLFPVIVITLSGDVPERTLNRLARGLRDKLEAVPSVLEVSLSGLREEVVEIVIDPLLVESYGLNNSEVAQLLGRSNRVVAAGNLDTGIGRFAITVPGLFETAEDILKQPVQVAGDAVVRFGDIAAVRPTFKDPEGFARVNGAPAVALEISKRSGENVIDTIAAVRAVVEEERGFWPDTLQVTYSQDQSEFIELMLHDLENHVVTAVLLVMTVIVGALGMRSAALVGISIPGSFLASILILYLMGLTVNIIVLFALILSVGMLVDAAIMVVEYADRKMAEGLARAEAYQQASQRMALPIISATATTLAAFLPLLFWPGVLGEFMRYFPITVLATLSASLAMALIFVPTLGAYWGRVEARDPRALRRLAAAESGDLSEIQGFGRWYLRILEFCLQRPVQVLILVVVLLVAVWYAYLVYGRGIEFFPEVEMDSAMVLIHARGNLSVHQKDVLVREVEAQVLVLREEFKSVYSRTAGDNHFDSNVAEDVIGQILIELEDWDVRRPADAILAEIRERTRELAGIRVETRTPEVGPPVGKPVQVELRTRFPERLPAAAAQVRAFMESLPGLEDTEDDRPLPGIEWEIQVDRAQAAKFGLDVTAVGDAVKLVTNGLKLGTYRPDDSDEEIDIMVRYPLAWRTVHELDQVRVVTALGPVPISNFVEREAQPTVGRISRVDGERVMTVRANLVPGVLADDKVREIRNWLETEAQLDPAVNYVFRGEDEERAAAEAFLVKAFFIAIFMMAIILVTQFNRFYSAFLVLFAVVLSTIGALIGLLVMDLAFGTVVTGIGIIALAGVVVNDNIVLIDTHQRLRETTASAREAILRTGVLRLRPVILTTVTTALGLLPMMLRTNIDLVGREIAFGAPATQWWVSLATAVIFGLCFATVLTLIVTPCGLMLGESIAAWRRHRPLATT